MIGATWRFKTGSYVYTTIGFNNGTIVFVEDNGRLWELPYDADALIHLVETAPQYLRRVV